MTGCGDVPGSIKLKFIQPLDYPTKAVFWFVVELYSKSVVMTFFFKKSLHLTTDNMKPSLNLS